MGNPAGNERLTTATAAVLLVLLAVEGVTIVLLRPLLSVHVFVGMLLIPPVLLKLASTGYRFARYYAASSAYRLQGPPQLLMRLLAPMLVPATVALFATGVALLVLGPDGGWVLGLHKASFVVWFVVMSAHVLVYARRIPRLAAATIRGRVARARGGRARIALVLGILFAGIVLAAATLPLADPWLRLVVRDGG